MLEYYEQHKNNFILKKDIVSMQYLVLHNDSPGIHKFRQYLRSDLPEEMDSLALYCSRYANAFNILEDYWIDLDDMNEIVPLETYTFTEFAANRRYFELQESPYIYMIYFRDYKPTDSIAPAQLVKAEIRKSIMNRRKNSLIKNMRQTVLQDAIEHNQVEIY
jgi:hypothetical protein